MGQEVDQEKDDAYSPSTSGKTNEKTSIIQKINSHPKSSYERILMAPTCRLIIPMLIQCVRWLKIIPMIRLLIITRCWKIRMAIAKASMKVSIFGSA